MKKMLVSTIKSISRLIFYPHQYFQDVGKKEHSLLLKKEATKFSLSLIALFIVLHSIGDLINSQIDRNIRVNLTEEARSAIANTFSEPSNGSYTLKILFSRVGYLIFWSFFIGFSIFCRWLLLKLLIMKNKISLRDLSTLTVLGILPLLLMSGIITFLNQVFPMSPYLNSNISIYIRVIFTLVVGFVAIRFEKRILNESLVLYQDLEKGATSLIWLSPYILLYIIFSSAILLIRIFE